MAIAQTRDRIIFANDTGYARIVYLDGRNDSNSFPSMFGFSVGHWEGSTLVVKTTKISGKFIGQGLRNGWPMSDGIVLTEWFSKSPDGKMLNIKRVFEDPVNYKEPIGSMVHFESSTDDMLMSPCAEGLPDEPYVKAARDLDKKLGK